MGASVLVLSKATNRTKTGPRLQKDADALVVEYDYENDDGTIEWSHIVFRDVLALEYRDISCCEAGGLVSSTEVRCLSKSDRLSAIVGLWQESVGWQEWQQKQGGVDRFKHFTLYFDDSCCIDVIAASCQVP